MYRKDDIFGLRLRCPNTKEVGLQARELLSLSAETMCAAQTSETVANEALHCLLSKSTRPTAAVLKQVANLLSRSSDPVCLTHALALGKLDEASKGFPALQDARIEVEAAWQLRCRQSFLAWKKLQGYRRKFVGCLKNLESIVSRLDRAQTEEKVAKDEHDAQTEKFAAAKHQWNKFSTEMYDIVVKSRRIKEVLGVVPTRTKKKLEDTKELLEQERKVFEKSLTQIATSKKKHAESEAAVQALESERQEAEQVVQTAKAELAQVKELVDKALHLQRSWTEALKLELAKRARREKLRRKDEWEEEEEETEEKEEKEEEEEEVSKQPKLDNTEFEGLVKVSVNGNTVYNYREAAQSLSRDNGFLQKKVEKLETEWLAEQATAKTLRRDLADSARALQTAFQQAEQKHKECRQLNRDIQLANKHSRQLENELDAARREIAQLAAQSKCFEDEFRAKVQSLAEDKRVLQTELAKAAAASAGAQQARKLDQENYKKNTAVLIQRTNELAGVAAVNEAAWAKEMQNFEDKLALVKRQAAEKEAELNKKIQSLDSQLLAATRAYDDLGRELEEAREPDMLRAFSTDLDLSRPNALRKTLTTIDLQLQADMELMMRRDSDLRTYIEQLEQRQLEMQQPSVAAVAAVAAEPVAEPVDEEVDEDVDVDEAMVSHISINFADLNREIDHLLGHVGQAGRTHSKTTLAAIQEAEEDESTSGMESETAVSVPFLTSAAE